MTKVYTFLANGFEEVEALCVIDLLKRASMDVVMVSVSGDLKVNGAHNIDIMADVLFEDASFEDVDVLFLPGGMPGTKNLDNHEGLKQKLVEFNNNGKLITAICAAPMVLGHLGILNGKDATCYPGFEQELIGANVLYDNVVVDGNVITSRGMGTAIDLGLKLIEVLIDKDASFEMAEKICYTK